MKRIIMLGFMVLLSVYSTAQKFDQLALTPPMGWNSWNKFSCNVSEDLMRQVADAMASNGMKDAGYQYINIDDCWHGERDSLGFIHPNKERFPSGMKALADYIHSKGLKLGIYSDAGWKTCGGKPGSRGFEYQDALTYAKWGVDYLKYDWCNSDALKAEGAYLTMRDALYFTGHPIVFSICEWGDSKPWTWAKNVGHLWRTTGDIYNCFDCVIDHGTWFSWGILPIIDKQEGLRLYAGPGHWNDPDMLEVGNGMPTNEDRAHFSMWCMLAAPLIAGNDLRSMTKETSDILKNKEVIAVDQDSLGIQGFRFEKTGNMETWMKPLQNESWAICFLNRGDKVEKIDFNWKYHWIYDNLSNKGLNTSESVFNLRDVWKHKDIGTTEKNLTGEILPHDVLMVVLTKK